jgi:hypothetical protein
MPIVITENYLKGKRLKKTHKTSERTVNNMKEFLRNVETLYGLPHKGLYYRDKISGKPTKRINGVNVSDVRQAAYYVMSQAKPMIDETYGRVFELERTSIIHIRRTSSRLAEVRDSRFWYHVEKIRGLIPAFVEKSCLQICKPFVFSLHERATKYLWVS